MNATIRGVLVAATVAAIMLGGAAPVGAVEPPPVNDDFADAIAFSSDSGWVDGTNAGATKELGEPAHAGAEGGASIWYRWTAGRSGQAVFSTCGSDIDTVLAIYTGTAVGSLTQIGASAVDCGAGSGVSFRASAGTEYHIAVDGQGGETGSTYLEWFQRPANDDRADAASISGDTGTVDSSNRYGSLEPNEPEPGGPGGASVWFRWTAPSSGPARFDTCMTGYDTLLAVYEGASTAAIAASDDACGGGSLVGFLAEGGKEYLIAVDGYEGDWIAGPLRWDRSLVSPSTRDRPEISGNPQEGDTLTGSNGTWAGTPPFSYTYEWWRCNAAATTCYVIPGATGPTHVLGAGDVGSRIRFWVRAENGAGWDAMNSAATAPVAPRPHTAPTNRSVPSISGTAVVGGTLAAAAGAWSGYPDPAYTYEWQECSPSGAICATISAGSNSTLGLTADEAGSRIRVVVIATNAAGSARAESALTPVVARPGGETRARCVVPNIRGRTLVKAKAAIKRSRCRTGRVRKAYSRAVRKGLVISQTPRAGVRMRVGTRVDLLVSKGKRR
ncbi:MAG: PASTA domain-containing protein [Gaiellaceae bacterium]